MSFVDWNVEPEPDTVESRERHAREARAHLARLGRLDRDDGEREHRVADEA